MHPTTGPPTLSIAVLRQDLQRQEEIGGGIEAVGDELVVGQGMIGLQGEAGGRLVGDPVLNRIVLATTALMEVKRSMGVIVAAPTAGACAALPAAVITLAESLQLDEEMKQEVNRAIAALPPKLRTAWVLFAVEDLKIVEIAQVEGCSVGAIKNRLFHARRRLQARLREYLEI